jgi:hypothetical protein
MKSPFLEAFVSTAYQAQQPKGSPGGEMITVNETVSAAASVYETIRNSLEYDEEHLLRRNAIRRILKRHWGEADMEKLSTDLLHELIWARYFPNKHVSVSVIAEVAAILEKFQPLFVGSRALGGDEGRRFQFLMDILSAEIEYHLSPPTIGEALAAFAYQDLKGRFEWATTLVKEDDRDLQLYLAVHRAVLKSNVATLRYRIFTLFYPDWTKHPTPELVETVAGNLASIADAVEKQIRHPARDRLFRLVQKHAVVYQVLRDIVSKDPAGFSSLLEDPKGLQKAVAESAMRRYDKFRVKVRRSIIRAIAFLLLTKTVLALIVELPYDVAIAKTQNYFPLMVNILFHPLLLGIIGLTVTIPEEVNTSALNAELHGVVGLSEPKAIKFATRRPWAKGGLRLAFDILYVATFVFVIGIIAFFLKTTLDFSALSIFFFLFFLSLVTFFGLKIRGSRREIVVVEGKGTFVGPLFDMFFLPIVRAGRWISLRAPRINIFLFFFDFIIEAPFKAAIKLVEGWLAFLREKREEI